MKLEDKSLVDLLAETLPDFEEPDETVYWTSNNRTGNVSPKGRRSVLIEFSSVEDKHKLLKMFKQLHQNSVTLDDWLTDCNNSRGAPLSLTLTSKVWKQKATSPSSEALYQYTTL